MSASIDFRHRDRIISMITLSDQEAISWLKENEPDIEDYSTNYEFDQNQVWRCFVEYVWYRRNSSRLRLALAKYGSTNPTLDRLKKSNKYKKTLLSNVLAYPEQGFVKGFNNIFSKTEISQIIENWPKTKNELLIFFNNKNISRDFINDFLSDKKSLFAKKNDERSSLIVALIANNPVIKKSPPDDIKYDGWSNYNFGKLSDTLLEVIKEAPATDNWSVALRELIKENPFRYTRNAIDEKQFLKKWKDSAKDKKPKFGGADRSYLDLRMAFWKFYAQNIIHLSSPFDVKSSDKESLSTMVRLVDASEWLSKNIDDRNFEPPIFDQENMAAYDRYDDEKQNSAETNEVREIIQSLFDKGVELHDFIFADHLYANKKRRQLLSRVVREYDKNITEWETHRWREDAMRDKYPKAFEDEYELDLGLENNTDEQSHELLTNKSNEIWDTLSHRRATLRFFSPVYIKEKLVFYGSVDNNENQVFLDCTDEIGRLVKEQLQRLVKPEHSGAFSLKTKYFYVYLSHFDFTELPEMHLEIEFKPDEDGLESAHTSKMTQGLKTIDAAQWGASLHIYLREEQLAKLINFCRDAGKNATVMFQIEFDPEAPVKSDIADYSLTYRLETTSIRFRASFDEGDARLYTKQNEHELNVEKILEKSQKLEENDDRLRREFYDLADLFHSMADKNADRFKTLQIYFLWFFLLFILLAVYLIFFA